MFQRPEALSGGNIPSPTACVAQSLRLGQVGLTAPQRLFRPLALGDVSHEYRQPAVGTWEDSVLHPLSQRRVIMLMDDYRSFTHCATERLLGRRVWEFLPQRFPDEIRGILAEGLKLLFSMLVEIRISPFAVKSKELVGDAVEDYLDSLVSLSQQLFGALALGDIHDSTDVFGEGAGLVQHRMSQGVKMFDRPVMNVNLTAHHYWQVRCAAHREP